MATNNSDNSVGSSVQSIGKNLPPRKELLKKLKNRLLTEIEDNDYITRIIKCLEKSKVSSENLMYLLKFQGKLVCDDSKLFSLYKNETPVPKPSPRCPETIYDKPGPILSNIPRKKISLYAPDLVIEGCGGRYKSIITTNTSENEHVLLSLLKYYLSALIVFFKINAYSLIGQKWLNNAVDGPAFITLAFEYYAFIDNFHKIRKLKIPVLMVQENYSKGIHIGNKYMYVSDGERVIGCHRGDETPYWLDHVNNLPRSGYYEGYEVQTLMDFGSQRLIYMYPTEENNVPKKFSGRSASTLLSESIRCSIPEKLDTQSNFLLGLEIPDGYFEDDEDEFDTNIFNVQRKKTGAERLAEMQEPNVKEFLALTFKQKFCCVNWKLLFVELIISVILMYYRLRVKTFFSTVSNVLSLLLTMLTIHYGSVDRLKIDIDGSRIIVTGPYAEEFLKYAKGKYISPIDHLPYGFYVCKGGCIVRTDQLDSTANYTNLIYLVQEFTTERGFAAIGWKKMFKSLFRFDGMAIGTNSDAAFTPRIPSEIKAVASDVPFSIKFTEKSGVDVKLWSDEALRNYIIPKHTKEVYYSIGSHRAVPGGYRSKFTEEQHLSFYKEFWIKFVDQRIDYSSVDPYPNLTRYTGRKLRKYLAALAKLGVNSFNAFISTFIKVEALPYSNLFKKPARIISPNTVMFNLFYKNWFHKFEELLLAVTYKGVKLFAKGSTLQVRYDTISVLTARYRYTVPIDFKGFDFHHKLQAYTAEMLFYGWIGLLPAAVQSLIRCKVDGVIKYDRPQRHSGDLFTGSGNCLVVGSLLARFLDGNEFTFYCDGDDTLLFMNDTNLFFEIRRFLLEAGYEISSDDGFIDNRRSYVIPFCQVYYKKEGFYVDIDRNLNKMGNLTAANLHTMASIIYGKLQSLNIYHYFGLKYDYDICSVLKGIEPEGEIKFKLEQIECMRSYLKIEYGRYLPLDESAGLIGKICLKIKESILLDLYISILPQKWNQKLLRRRITKIIYAELQRSAVQQEDLPLKTVRLLHHVEYLVKNFGLQSIATALVDALSRTQHSQVGSPLFLNSTKVIECTQYVSAGKLATTNSQPDTSTPHIIQIETKNLMPLTTLQCLDSNEPRSSTYQQVEASISQPRHGSTPQTDVQQQETTATSSTSSTMSSVEIRTQAQSKSHLNTMSLSSPHKSQVLLQNHDSQSFTCQEATSTTGLVSQNNQATLKAQLTELATHGKQPDLGLYSTAIKYSIKSSQPQLVKKKLITYLSSLSKQEAQHIPSVFLLITQKSTQTLVTSDLSLETLPALLSVHQSTQFQLLRQEILAQVPQLMYADSTLIALLVLWCQMIRQQEEAGQLNLVVKQNSLSQVSSLLTLNLEQLSPSTYQTVPERSVVPYLFTNPSTESIVPLLTSLSSKISMAEVLNFDLLPIKTLSIPISAR